MLHHKFYLSCEPEKSSIRISDTLIRKMQKDLLQFKFTWNGYSEPKYGLGRDGTIIQPTEVKNLQVCLMRQSHQEQEYAKFMRLIDRAMEGKQGIIHIDGSQEKLTHKFVLIDHIPPVINPKLAQEMECVEIQDQFFRENFNVFQSVKTYWDTPDQMGVGFNYYGITIITSEMAQNLLTAMALFIKNNSSEQAQYFVGEEYDELDKILSDAVAKQQILIHFGI